MPAERLTIRKIREVVRLKFDCDISNRQIAKSFNIALSTVRVDKQDSTPWCYWTLISGKYFYS